MVKTWSFPVVMAMLSALAAVPARAQVGEGSGPPKTVALRGAVVVPMPIYEHFPTVEARLNGKGPYRFTIDTGFGGAVEVSDAVARELALQRVGEITGGDPSGVNARTFPVHALTSIDIGGASFSDLRVIVGGNPRLEAGGFAGTIGFTLFADLLVTLDYPGQQLRLERGTLGDDAAAISYDLERGVPAVDVSVAGVTVRADVDAGAPSLFTLPIAMARQVPLAAEPRVVGKGRTVTNEITLSAAPLAGDLKVGAITIASPELTFVDLLPYAHFGARFLRQYAVTFDTAHRLVRFAKP